MLLLALAFSNASEVLVRTHHFPSVLQLLVPVVLATLLLRGARARAADPALALPRRVLTFAAIAYLAVLAASTTWAEDAAIADRAVLALTKAALLGLVLAHVVDSPALLRRAAWTLVLTGAVLATLSSVQVLTGDWRQTFAGFARVKHAHIAGESLGSRATGPLADPNFYAQALLGVAPMAVALAIGEARRAWRALAALAAAALALGVVTSYSRGGALALGIALVVLAFLERRRIRAVHVLAAAGAVAVGLALTPASAFVRRLETLQTVLPGADRQDSSVVKRRVLMAAAASMALEHPLAGVGAGNYTVHFEEHAARVGARGRVYQDPGEAAFPHSLPLEVAAETGLLGLATLALAVGAAWWGARAGSRAFARLGRPREALLAHGLLAGLAGTVASSLILHGDYPRYLWMLLGLCAACAAAARGNEVADTA